MLPRVKLDQEGFRLNLPVAPKAREKSGSWSRRKVKITAKIMELMVKSEL